MKNQNEIFESGWLVLEGGTLSGDDQEIIEAWEIKNPNSIERRSKFLESLDFHSFKEYSTHHMSGGVEYVLFKNKELATNFGKLTAIVCKNIEPIREVYILDIDTDQLYSNNDEADDIDEIVSAWKMEYHFISNGTIVFDKSENGLKELLHLKTEALGLVKKSKIKTLK